MAITTGMGMAIVRMGLNHLGRIDSLRNKTIDLNASINNARNLKMPKVAIGVPCAMAKIQKWCLSYDWEYDFNKSNLKAVLSCLYFVLLLSYIEKK
jgi:hypothetical protein